MTPEIFKMKEAINGLKRSKKKAKKLQKKSKKMVKAHKKILNIFEEMQTKSMSDYFAKAASARDRSSGVV